MPRNADRLFRREALEHLLSPEQLDQRVVLVPPREWILLSSIALLLAAGVIWGVWGALPMTVSGAGILVHPQRILPVQAITSGRIAAVHVRPGEQITVGTLVATVDQTETHRQLQQAQTRLTDLRAQDESKTGLEKRRLNLELKGLEIERAGLDLERAHDENALAGLQALVPVLQKRLEAQQQLVQSGLISRIADEMVLAQQSLAENAAKITDLQTQLKQVDVRRQQLDSRRDRLLGEQLEAATARRNEIEALSGANAVLQMQLVKNSEVRSQYAGRVLELLIEPGAVVPAGGRLASIDQGRDGNDSVALLYFPVSDGKQIRRGMNVQVTPDTVKRERFGGILARVTEVSGFPVTREATITAVGSVEVSDRLLANGPQIQVVAELASDPSTVSGYRWSSSRGPALQISTGTTVTARVTVEERAPITYVFPFLRALSGVY